MKQIWTIFYTPRVSAKEEKRALQHAQDTSEEDWYEKDTFQKCFWWELIKFRNNAQYVHA